MMKQLIIIPLLIFGLAGCQQQDLLKGLDLKTHDLPSRPRMEIAKMFPSDSLVSSPRAEKARLYSAIEQRLEQSLRSMEGVLSARVHVSYDLDTSESRVAKPVHLSALAVYGKDIEATLMISDIKRFLKNSFSEVGRFRSYKRDSGTTLALILLLLLTLVGTVAFLLWNKRKKRPVDA